jgi:L-seryl-tRNA(Ser) seleniumtransferase
VLEALRLDPAELRERTERLAARIDGRVVEHDGRVGGGGGAEVPLPGWAIALDAELASPLRTGQPAVVTTVRDGECLLDLRCIPQAEEEQLLAAVAAARARLGQRGEASASTRSATR